MKIFNRTNANKIIESEYHYFVTPNELTEPQQLLTSQKRETARHNGPPNERTHHHL